eukprot:GHVO01010708.1.p1 GENE.GHVO01010708.1~~GHVO01010708.1.p1  ORF type:complete len:270 (-),score=42.11 GHVO01010708.1:121-855(-)
MGKPYTGNKRHPDSYPIDRTLLVSQFDTSLTDVGMKEAFAMIAPVRAAHLHHMNANETQSCIAFVVFETPQGLLDALRTGDHQGILTMSQVDYPKGRGKIEYPLRMNKSIKDMLFQDPYEDAEALRTRVDRYLSSYDMNNEGDDTEGERDAFRDMMEADGFTLVKPGANSGVVRGGQSKPETSLKEFGGKRVTQVESSRKKKKTKVTDDFYRFQIREKNQDVIIAAREKNAIDQKAIEDMLHTS